MNNTLDLFIFILPFAFALHNIEEIFGMEKWSNSIPAFIHSLVSTKQFAIAAGLFTIMGFVIIFARSFYPNEKMHLLFVAGFAGMLFLNVFSPLNWKHLFTKIYTGTCIRIIY